MCYSGLPVWLAAHPGAGHVPHHQLRHLPAGVPIGGRGGHDRAGLGGRAAGQYETPSVVPSTSTHHPREVASKDKQIAKKIAQSIVIEPSKK